MNYGYVVRFVRRDEKPDEEYFYNAPEEAKIHFEMFADDTSRIYNRIEMFSYETPNKIQLAKIFE